MESADDGNASALPPSFVQFLAMSGAGNSQSGAGESNSATASALQQQFDKLPAQAKEKILKGLPKSGLGLSMWDPHHSPDWDAAPYPHSTLMRIKKDMMEILRDPPQGIVMVPRPMDMTSINCLIMGTSDTPYENGFFLFFIRCPPNYPISPPRVKLMTTDRGTVRFNPNLYHSGKVCLSILGTWQGPAWSPALGLSALVLSIQSLMNEKPYHNEPGFEKTERIPGDSNRYNLMIRHETLRVAVCGTVRDCLDDVAPQQLKEVVIESFLGFFDTYLSEARANTHLDGQTMVDPFTQNSTRKFQYGEIVKTLVGLRADILAADFEFLKNCADAHNDEDEQDEDDSDSGGKSNDDAAMQSAMTP